MPNVVLFTGMTGTLFQRALGAYQVASHLRSNGYTVQVIDHLDHFSDSELDEVFSKFVGEQTLALGISSTFFSDLTSTFISTDKNFESILPPRLEERIRRAKAEWPSLKVIFGGARSLSGESLDYVDCVVHGYAEDKVLSYLDSLPGTWWRETPKTIPIATALRSGPKVISSAPLNLEEPFDIQVLDHKFDDRDCITSEEVLPIEISRGCIFKCKFCAFPLNGKKKMDYLREADYIKEEMFYNFENFGTTSYFFCDDTLNDSTVKLEKLHRAITDLPFKINFITYLRADLLYAHKEQISLLREMGLASPFFGIESLNQKSVTSIGKGMSVEKLKTFLYELYFDHWKSEVPITCSFIVGLPHETEGSLEDTFNWVDASPMNSIFFPLVLDMKSPYPSEFNRNFMEYGYAVDPKTGKWANKDLTQDRASEIATQYNSRLMYSEDTPSSWFLLTLLNNGMTLEQATSTKVKDLNWHSIIKASHRRASAYKSLLLNSTFF